METGKGVTKSAQRGDKDFIRKETFRQGFEE
jgi:hypothetical protein